MPLQDQLGVGRVFTHGVLVVHTAHDEWASQFAQDMLGDGMHTSRPMYRRTTVDCGGWLRSPQSGRPGKHDAITDGALSSIVSDMAACIPGTAPFFCDAITGVVNAPLLELNFTTPRWAQGPAVITGLNTDIAGLTPIPAEDGTPWTVRVGASATIATDAKGYIGVGGD